jgi:hypothetical protein
MHTVPMLVFAVSSALVTHSAMAIDTCIPVRPPGLSPAAVDEIVLRKSADALALPTQRVDINKTIKQLDPSDNAPVRYALIVVDVSEALGFDSNSAFGQADKASGATSPLESVTVAALQAQARKAYFAGTDAPPPPAPSGATFGTRRFTVAVPREPPKWSLIECGISHFSFAARNASTEDFFVAVAEDIRLEPYKNDELFLAQVRAAMAKAAPAGYTMTSNDVRIVRQSGRTCALSNGEAAPTAPRLPGSLPYVVYAQFCYDSAEYPYLGYAALFRHHGHASESSVRAMAMSFIEGVKPAR